MTVAVVTLGLVVGAQLIERLLTGRAWQTERRHLVAVAVARNAREVPVIENNGAARRPPKDPDERPQPLIGS